MSSKAQPHDLAKVYEPGNVEPRIREYWEKENLYQAGRSPSASKFSMVMPPPNVTGRLHVGHALNNTLPDILARYRRMDGCDVLWLPGTDHAGIATQNVVERELREQGTSRQELGREAFEKAVWDWKAEYGGIITRQLRLLGASCDWSRERFTLDPGLSRAVREVFVRLYEKGLLYRGHYLVNWCPRCETAISDLEVVPQSAEGQLTTIAYPLKDGTGQVEVATTRPETMLGDTAVALHPEDERRSELEGRTVILPLVDRELPLVFDPFVERGFGTGAVKVTPAHDPNDYAVGQRHGLEVLQVIDTAGRMMGPIPERFQGLTAVECRARVVKELEGLGRIVKREPYQHNVGRCQRCDEVVEPLPSTQWFVKVQPLAEPAIKAVEDGRISFFPARFANIYFEWMRNIRDWCVSRQLWWGHRIPAWYCDPCGKTWVSREDLTNCEGCGEPLRQDPDVLDTWFSSALWPFSTMGWPDQTDDLARYYPTDVLLTGFDIIFFWVARMIMMGLEFAGDIPFRTVYINGLVRDEAGQKMSKSRGNVIDPLDLIERYGTDATRFTLAVLASPGTDIPLAPKRMEGYQAFVNKVWNASRFVLMNLEGSVPGPLPARQELHSVDRWILSRLGEAADGVRTKLDAHRFDEAANQLYQFIWREYCDWYLELIKPRLRAGGASAERVRCVLHHTLSAVLRLLHPFTPFVTEEIWQKLPSESGSPGSVSVSPFPTREDGPSDPDAEREVELLVEVVTKFRNLRAESAAVGAHDRVGGALFPHQEPDREVLTRLASEVETLARLSRLEVRDGPPEDLAGMLRGVAAEVEVFVEPPKAADPEAELQRVERELEKIDKEITSQQRKLDNPKFLEKAPPEVVEKNRGRLAELEGKREKLNAVAASLREQSGS